MLKIWKVTFNDGGWHSGSLPHYFTVAETSKQAEDEILTKHPMYAKGYDCWASEFKMEGYVIEVHDKKSYNRDKSLNKILEDDK